MKNEQPTIYHVFKERNHNDPEIIVLSDNDWYNLLHPSSHLEVNPLLKEQDYCHYAATGDREIIYREFSVEGLAEGVSRKLSTLAEKLAVSNPEEIQISFKPPYDAAIHRSHNGLSIFLYEEMNPEEQSCFLDVLYRNLPKDLD